MKPHQSVKYCWNEASVVWNGLLQFLRDRDRARWDMLLLSLRCSYLWPWSPRGPRPAAGLRGRCTAAIHQPRQWWTPVTRGSRNKALWVETKHSRCHGNCACSAGTQAPQTVLGIGTLGRERNQEPKLHEFMNAISRWLSFLTLFGDNLVPRRESSVRWQKTTTFPFSLFWTTYWILFFQLFIYFFTLSESSCFLISYSLALRLFLSHSVSFTDADVLISGETTGRTTTSLGNPTFCIFTHSSTHFLLLRVKT